MSVMSDTCVCPVMTPQWKGFFNNGTEGIGGFTVLVLLSSLTYFIRFFAYISN